MMQFFRVLLVIAPFFLAQTNAYAKDVVKDQGAVLTEEELSQLVARWTPQMQDVAARDMGDRFELLSKMLANKKMAMEADRVVAEMAPVDYWAYQSGLESYKVQFLLKQFASTIVIPDTGPLASEMYETQKDKYAKIPEKRISSHILFAAEPGVPRDDILVAAQTVLDELRAGADFFAMVEQHSQEPGAVQKKGKFDKWVAMGDTGVAPQYLGGLFDIKAVGEYSELVQTKFGVHIIRLDDVQASAYKPFAEVEAKIVADIELEYRKLAIKDYVAQFQITEKAFIDGPAMDRIFAPYLKQ